MVVVVVLVLVLVLTLVVVPTALPVMVEEGGAACGPLTISSPPASTPLLKSSLDSSTL